MPWRRQRRGLRSKPDGGKKTRKEGGAVSGDDGSWVTLCQVGRAFYLLTDMCVYAFLFSLSLYYTLVVLGKDLTFNRLVVMFLFGLGVPAAFLALAILLHALLPTRAHFGASCRVEALGEEEFHWATTGPKLVCVVLSLCLITVSSYGFWRLRVPALRASAETFYARQGVLKTLALLLACSLAELFHLVTEYQKRFDDVTSERALLASTCAFGLLKGGLLAFLGGFLDGEVLHGTCCAPRAAPSPSQPWVRTVPGVASSRAKDEEEEDGEEESLGNVSEDVEGGTLRDAEAARRAKGPAAGWAGSLGEKV